MAKSCLQCECDEDELTREKKEEHLEIWIWKNTPC
jgi:hypothetical protein